MLNNSIDQPTQSRPICDVLREVRQQCGASIAEVESETKIRSSYLEALESGDYSKLPADIYVRRILRSLAYYFGLESVALLRKYYAEKEEYMKKEKNFQALNLEKVPAKRRSLIKPFEVANYVHAHRVFMLSMATLAILLLSGYIFHQVQSFSAAPDLIIEQPRADISFEHRTIIVRGMSEVGSVVTVNNQEVLTDSVGRFEIPYELSNGQNLITIVAQAKNGKTSREVRTVNASFTEPTAPASPADGFYAVVSTTGKAWIRVSLDGELEYEGTMSANSDQRFEGSDNIEIRTGNAGATRIAINGRDQGLVGDDGEIGTYAYEAPSSVGMAK